MRISADTRNAPEHRGCRTRCQRPRRGNRRGASTPCRAGQQESLSTPRDISRAEQCWLGRHIVTPLQFVEDRQAGYILSQLAFRATSERRIDSFHDLLAAGDKQRAPLVAKALGAIYGEVLTNLIRSSATIHGTPQQHFNRVWDHWRQAAAGFDWKRWGFPSPEESSYADGRRNWINPLACIENSDCWADHPVISFAWGWQHRDLNTRNVLVSPSGVTPPELRLIDMEKVTESSAFIDLSWVCFWALVAGADRELAVREQTWEQLPDAFINHSLDLLNRATVEVRFDCGISSRNSRCMHVSSRFPVFSYHTRNARSLAPFRNPRRSCRSSPSALSLSNPNLRKRSSSADSAA